MCGGPVDHTCNQEYFDNVRKYTWDMCMQAKEGDYMECDRIANERYKAVQRRCEF